MDGVASKLVKAQDRTDWLKTPTVCAECGKARYYIQRCEHCQDNFKLSDDIEKVNVRSHFRPKGRFTLEHYNSQGELLNKFSMPNGITDEGKDHILDTEFGDGTQVASAGWFIALIDLSGFTALAPGDVMSSHGGWNEFTSYSEATRVAWGPGSASSQSITNATAATFNITGSGTVKGVFVPTNNVKSGTTGVLWATALFAADVPVSNGDQLKITYTVSA